MANPWAKLLGAIGLLVTVAVAGFTTGCSKESSNGSGMTAKGERKYHCPMHPTYVGDRPGDCPICNMKLVPIRDGEGGANSSMAGPGQKDPRFAHVKVGQFYCPMHPSIVSNASGVCPDCNMNLVQKKELSDQSIPERGTVAALPGTPPGRVSLKLSAEKRQLIGLTLSPVEKRTLTRHVRTAAVVQHDERRYYRIAPRFSGWVRKLFVNFTGALVEKGEPLFTVYSPELFSTENEYLIAWRGVQKLGPNASAAQREAAQALLDSARLRLELWQIDEKEIAELEQRGRASSEMLFRAPFSGHVLVKNAVEGKSFAAGESLYEIADLSHVWLLAYIYEFELPLIRVGMDATVSFPYLDNQSYESKVTFIYPHIEPATRRGQIRLELPNHEHRLRPDMWANVELELDLGEKLAVPRSALIDTGERFIAFVSGADDHLEPREIKVGARTDDYCEVLSGVQAGEQLVTRALFLVDSESQLKAAIAGMTSGGAYQH